MPSYYPEWVAGTAYTAGQTVQRNALKYTCLSNHTAAVSFFSDAGKWRLDEANLITQGKTAAHSGTATAASGSAVAIAARQGRIAGLLQNLSDTNALRVSTAATDGTTGFYLEPLTGVNLSNFGASALYIARDTAAGADVAWTATETY